MPITTWNYRTQDPHIRHIGPMAQDFMAAFQVGEDDRHITTIDPDGVALAGIQALDLRTDAQATQTQALAQRTRALEQENEALKRRLQRLEQVLEDGAAPL